MDYELLEETDMAGGLAARSSRGDRRQDLEVRGLRRLIRALGDDPDRAGLQRTPARVAAMLRFLTSGYHTRLHDLLNDARFDVAYDQAIQLRDIEVFSLCEHHLLPFFGKAHITYVPDRQVIGLSKIPRIVDMFARRLQIQERLTTQIARAIQEAIEPKGVAVTIEARHLCLMMRGVEKQGASVVTHAALGALAETSTSAGDAPSRRGPAHGRCARHCRELRVMDAGRA